MRPTPRCPNLPHCAAVHYPSTIPTQRTEPPNDLRTPIPDPNRRTRYPSANHHAASAHHTPHPPNRVRHAIRTAYTRLTALSRFRWLGS